MGKIGWVILVSNCHINVELVFSVKSVKYLYKYVYNVFEANMCLFRMRHQWLRVTN